MARYQIVKSKGTDNSPWDVVFYIIDHDGEPMRGPFRYEKNAFDFIDSYYCYKDKIIKEPYGPYGLGPSVYKFLMKTSTGRKSTCHAPPSLRHVGCSCQVAYRKLYGSENTEPEARKMLEEQ